MKNYITLLLLLITASTFSQSTSKIQKRVLIVLSSYGKDNGNARPGFEFEEFVDAYNIFTQNNVKVIIASPKGGSVTADIFDATKEKNKAFLTNENTAYLLKQTVATAQVDADNFDAIYIIGGKGAMFDIPYDPSLQDIILKLYNRKGTVLASVCHGTSAFIHVKHQNKFILDKERITGFSNEEENIFKSQWIDEFPFLLEDALKSRGAKYQKSSFMLENVVISGKFITGQNPASTKVSAEAVVQALGNKLEHRSISKQDATLDFIKKFLNNQLNKNELFKESSEGSYHYKLIATYGFILIQNTKNNKENLENGIDLISFAKPYFFNKNFQLLVAKSQIKIGKLKQAKQTLEELIEKDFLKKEALALLNEITKS
ncbi:type 1 glutamine amidotransferase domain-containing protein [Polaribacter litorisediminis]|uniref:type 1 glutamine amidotransferase domain-containing protein n=1 Tax=Polaribacter litorisediminis TaxID=1908341 RepID=UPI001CBB1DB4|nr:type 1 glutamine amidotransferase domain-containing protein [Polaribacter litorisediminis]UAM97960.1 type 1 glutamine amidotransferase domain-containing protein [Polaribacter litorisediminis]